MKKFLSETIIITLLAAVSLALVAAYEIYNQLPFSQTVPNVCYSIIAAYIFYLFQVYLPEKKKKEAISARIRDYIVHRILDNLGFISSSLEDKEEDSISPELSKSIIDAGTEAYNNLFKCLDDFSQTMDGDTSDAIYKLTNDQFLYDLYTLYKVKRVFPEDEEYNDLVLGSYQKYKGSFINSKEELSRLVTASTESKSQMSSYTKDELKKKRGIIIEDSGDIKKIVKMKAGETP